MSQRHGDTPVIPALGKGDKETAEQADGGGWPPVNSKLKAIKDAAQHQRHVSTSTHTHVHWSVHKKKRGKWEISKPGTHGVEIWAARWKEAGVQSPAAREAARGQESVQFEGQILRSKGKKGQDPGPLRSKINSPSQVLQ